MAATEELHLLNYRASGEGRRRTLRKKMPQEKSGLDLGLDGPIRRIALLCHRQADADTYLSAWALRCLLKQLVSTTEVDIVIPEGMSVLTQRLSLTFPSPPPSDPSVDYDLLIAVDIGHTELLAEWAERLRKSSASKVLIDHHPVQKDTPYDKEIVDTNASSAGEIVYRIFASYGVDPNPEVATALLIAILFDSQNLSIAKAETLRVVLALVDRGAKLEDARVALRSKPDYGEVMAKLKAARRLKIYKFGQWVVTVSRVGSYQANVARAFVHLGADLALVVGEFEDELRGSLRASQSFHADTKIHLGTDLASSLSHGRGYGGGHPTAASFTLIGVNGDEREREERIVSEFLALLGRLLSERAAEIA